LNAKTVPLIVQPLPRRRLLSYGLATAGTLLLPGGNADAQTIEARHWSGTSALTRQPEHVVASTTAEWRSLWGRVGSAAPDVFEPGRMHAVGIFLGRRSGEGYAVNVLSTSRRRDRIVVVFEERMPAEFMMAQRSAPPPATRPVASAPNSFAAAPGASFAPSAPGAAAGFAPSGTGAGLAPPPPSAPARPVGQPTSPWAIILIPRADLPISVEQRLFR
jgi:hypothetical protein